MKYVKVCDDCGEEFDTDEVTDSVCADISMQCGGGLERFMKDPPVTQVETDKGIVTLADMKVYIDLHKDEVAEGMLRAFKGDSYASQEFVNGSVEIAYDYKNKTGVYSDE